jgi:glutamate racemase
MNNAQRNPIGMLDSGLGGLTVLRRASSLLPYENFIFYGDLKHSPYGGRSKDELIGLIGEVVDILLTRGIKALVLASNTGTSAAALHLRENLTIPVIGTEPALKPAIQAKRPGKILVLATQLTLKEEKFHRLYQQYQDQASIILKSCPGLVELIDSGLTSGKQLDDYLTGLFQDVKHEPISTLVLGCTHYIIVQDQILKHFGNRPLCLDGNDGVARQIRNLLDQEGMLNTGPQPGMIQFLSSDPDRLQLLEKTYQELV